MFLLIFFAMLPRLPPLMDFASCPAVVLAASTTSAAVGMRPPAAQDAFLIISQQIKVPSVNANKSGNETAET
jgi:hypothetical protein